MLVPEAEELEASVGAEGVGIGKGLEADAFSNRDPDSAESKDGYD